MANLDRLRVKETEEFITKAITGLKAINRESREAIKGLRDLEKEIKEVVSRE